MELINKNKIELSARFLSISAAFWFFVALIGQAVFALYVIAFYYRPTLSGNFEHWNKVLPNGFVQGDHSGNLFLAAHLLLAAIVTVGGMIQIIPKIRTSYPLVHRWNGRIYISLAILIGLTGLYLIVTRGAFGGIVASYALGANALLMVLFGIVAWRYARIKKYQIHRCWALRLFFVASGVWFFRIGLMLWLFIFRAPVGFDPNTFTGPFLTFLYFACYLLPLAFLELYFYAQRQNNAHLKYGVGMSIFAVATFMGLGILSATLGLWLPRVGS